jgi:hypothetical protein
MAKTPTKPARPSLYSVHPTIAMVQASMRDLRDRTGKSVDEWVELVKSQGPKSTEDRATWLEQQHRLGTNFAWWVADRADGKGLEEDNPELYLQKAEQYVEQLFPRADPTLRPVYDALLSLGIGIGPDAKACPARTAVELYRNHLFAQIKPASAVRIDIGFALRGTKLKGRLSETGGSARGERITHRIGIGSLDDIDTEVKHWMKVAYEGDAK